MSVLGCIEVVQELPRAVHKQSRSQFFREITDQFIESNNHCWRVIKDQNGEPIDESKIQSFYTHFRQIITKEYVNKGVFITIRNGDIYLVKEGF